MEAGDLGKRRRLRYLAGAEDPLLHNHLVRRLQTDAALIWRRYYQMPPTDPRYLAATEDQILTDLALLRAQRRLEAPEPDVDEEELAAEKEALLARMGDKLRATVGGGTKPKTVSATDLRIRGRRRG